MIVSACYFGDSRMIVSLLVDKLASSKAFSLALAKVLFQRRRLACALTLIFVIGFAGVLPDQAVSRADAASMTFDPTDLSPDMQVDTSTLIPGWMLLNPSPAASANSIYWGATLYGHAADPTQFAPNGSYTRYENYIGRKLGIISWGAPWNYGGKFLNFQTSYFDNVRNHGSIPLLSWGSWACCRFIQPDYSLAKVASGKYDAFVRQWATDAKKWGHPFFLRFDHEMNGWWQFPWSTQANGNNAAQYVAAWRHVHDIFTQVGAKNVTWVWAPNIVSTRTTPLSKVYPGDGYVDWIGLDGYNWYTKQGLPWLSFPQLYASSYKTITGVAPSKPLMIAEFASVEAGDNGVKKSQWIYQTLTKDIPLLFPKIKAIVWFNWDDNASLTWPIESSNASRNAFAGAVKAPVYVNKNYSALNTLKIVPGS